MLMSGKLLDTNIVINLFREDPDTIAALNIVTTVYIPIIVLGELFYGANKSTRIQENINRIEALITEVKLLNCDQKTARIYGVVKAQLQKDGHPIPENDIWIAAVSKQYGLTLLTNDKHFSYVKGIDVEKLRNSL